MLKILWKRGEIAPDEQFLLLSTIFCYLMLGFYVTRGIRFSLRDKRLFEITEVEITRADCIYLIQCFRSCMVLSKVSAVSYAIWIILFQHLLLFLLNGVEPMTLMANLEFVKD